MAPKYGDIGKKAQGLLFTEGWTAKHQVKVAGKNADVNFEAAWSMADAASASFKVAYDHANTGSKVEVELDTAGARKATLTQSKTGVKGLVLAAKCDYSAGSTQRTFNLSETYTHGDAATAEVGVQFHTGGADNKLPLTASVAFASKGVTVGAHGCVNIQAADSEDRFCCAKLAGSYARDNFDFAVKVGVLSPDVDASFVQKVSGELDVGAHLSYKHKSHETVGTVGLAYRRDSATLKLKADSKAAVGVSFSAPLNGNAKLTLVNTWSLSDASAAKFGVQVALN